MSQVNVTVENEVVNVASGRLVLSLKDNVNPPTSFTAGIIQVSGTYIVN